VQIQIWAPGLDIAWLVDGLLQARLQVLPLTDPAQTYAELPLLIAYADPLGRLAASSPQSAAGHDALLLAALPQLERTVWRCRLVNLSCVALPALVAWCVEVGTGMPAEAPPRFALTDPYEALLVMAWLQKHPDQLQAYQALESHPLAAALDGRSPDLDCLGRYQQAASLDALLQMRQERAALQERCTELQLSFQAQQLDLEQFVRRLALLEQLVSAGSGASLRLQGRLAQALA
jgi:hypothetical protein